jgi:hypothetical protein
MRSQHLCLNIFFPTLIRDGGIRKGAINSIDTTSRTKQSYPEEVKISSSNRFMCSPVLGCCNLIFLAFGRHPTDVVLLEGDAVVGGAVVQDGGKSIREEVIVLS